MQFGKRKPRRGQSCGASKLGRGIAVNSNERDLEIEARCHGDSALAQANALYASGWLEQSLSLIRRALLVAERLHDSLPGSGLAMLLSFELFWLRDPAEAVAPLEHELAQPRLTEAALLRDAVFDWLGLVEALRGNLHVNKRPFGQAQRVWLQFEGVIAFYQGEWERADQVLAQALNQARQAGKHYPACAYRTWVGANMGRPKHRPGREIEILWRELDHEPAKIIAIFKMALLTAQRKTEVLGMTWEELDLDNGWMVDNNGWWTIDSLVERRRFEPAVRF